MLIFAEDLVLSLIDRHKLQAVGTYSLYLHNLGCMLPLRILGFESGTCCKLLICTATSLQAALMHTSAKDFVLSLMDRHKLKAVGTHSPYLHNLGCIFLLRMLPFQSDACCKLLVCTATSLQAALLHIFAQGLLLSLRHAQLAKVTL